MEENVEEEEQQEDYKNVEARATWARALKKITKKIFKILFFDFAKIHYPMSRVFGATCTNSQTHK